MHGVLPNPMPQSPTLLHYLGIRHGTNAKPRLLLHSCSGGPDDWIPIIHRLDVPFRNEIRFVVPCAPVRRESFDGWTKEQNSWFTYSEDGQHATGQLLEKYASLLHLTPTARNRNPEACSRTPPPKQRAGNP